MKSFLRKVSVLIVALATMMNVAKADKGMWLLHELTNGNWKEMKKLGFKLSSDQLYKLDGKSVARTVVIFGGGCSGVTASQKGLIMTNHHCGFSSIQKVSSVNHDYLRDGFVSQSFAEEIPIEGLSVKYLTSVVDVTDKIVAEADTAKDEVARVKKVNEVSDRLVQEEEKRLNDPFKKVIIEPFYAGNKFFMITYTVFKDIRLVFAPPSSVGKFGGDTDNWMWPRHTGDFSVFRVYADKDNKPANYSKDNVPYTPVCSAEVSTSGIKPGDFSMTIGFPGSTERYIPSFGIENMMKNENTPRIEVRGIKQAIWKKAMNADQDTRIKYASKYARSANYWKNSIGMNRGIKKLHVVERKQEEEARFQTWANSYSKYKTVLADMEQAYKTSGEANRKLTFLFESLYSGTELVKLSNMAFALANTPDEAKQKEIISELNKVYKDYLPALDKKVLPAMLEIIRKHFTKEERKALFGEIDQKYNGDLKAYTDAVFSGSIIPYQDKLISAYIEGNINGRLRTDPAFPLLGGFFALYRDLKGQIQDADLIIKKGNRLYFAGRKEQDPERLMPSDANFTMRMSYGKIGGYQPQDATRYRYYTTTKGILEKYVPKDTEFDLKADYYKLLVDQDFGRWQDKDGSMHVAFLSNNDITGGNSGSPVFNKNGRLIGLAFDGNWEAMSGDIEFEPNLQRTISVDIRYVLFVIEKWGKCPRLINELVLKDDVKHKKRGFFARLFGRK